MENNLQFRLALAEEIVQAMWVKGLFTMEDRDKIKALNQESLLKMANC